jgi:hypothetical protein
MRKLAVLLLAACGPAMTMDDAGVDAGEPDAGRYVVGTLTWCSGGMTCSVTRDFSNETPAFVASTRALYRSTSTATGGTGWSCRATPGMGDYDGGSFSFDCANDDVLGARCENPPHARVTTDGGCAWTPDGGR